MTGGPDGPDKITVAPCQKKLKYMYLVLRLRRCQLKDVISGNPLRAASNTGESGHRLMENPDRRS